MSKKEYALFLLSTLVSGAVVGCGGDKPTGGGGQGDMAMQCFTAPDDTAHAAARTSCTYQAGATTADTLGITAELRARLPIKHVIVLMKENRSFDHLLGKLSTAGQSDAEPLPDSFANLDAKGVSVPVSHATSTCIAYDPHHQWADMHAEVDGGKMDGFITNAQLHNDPAYQNEPPTDGHFVMSYYDQNDLPFYYWLASTFALADHHYPSVRSGTWSNRDFLVAGYSDGIQDTGSKVLPPEIPIIFDKLEAAKVSWGVYTDDLAPLEFSVDWSMRDQSKVGTVQAFFDALASDTLPAVSFVDGKSGLITSYANILTGETDEHPPADLQVGENWTRDLINKVVASKAWASTALFYTYDEAGGFADHVPPPSDACAPNSDSMTGMPFTELGVRVPLVVVSPFAKRHFVSHVRHEHTSILRFIEMLFDVPALTARDANSDAFLDMFDFCNPQTKVDTPPLAGTGKCVAPMM